MAKEESGRAMLEGIREAFGSVEWIEQEKFWTARVWFGEKDHAVIKVVSGGLITEVLSDLAKLDDLRKRLAGITDPAKMVEALNEVLTSANETLWLQVAQLFHECVCEVDLGELKGVEKYDLDFDLPEGKGYAETWPAYVRRLPIVLVVRVLIAIVVQAGNLLLRSSRA